MPDSAEAAKAAAESRAKILEGVDFIETEEDAEAVESAVMKMQSTFRGKKIRSKLGQKAPATTNTTTTTNATAGEGSANQRERSEESSPKADQSKV